MADATGRPPGDLIVATKAKTTVGRSIMERFYLLLAVFVFVPDIVRADVLLGDNIKDLKPEIRGYVERRAKAEDKSNKAVPYVSKVIVGDINGDKKEDIFIDYAIEGIGGGNLTLFFQALFLKNKNRYFFTAERSNGCFGTAQGKTYISKKISGGKVICESLAYAPEDGVCCPSIKGTGEITFKNGQLIAKSSSQNWSLYQWLHKIFHSW